MSGNNKTKKSSGNKGARVVPIRPAIGFSVPGLIGAVVVLFLAFFLLLIPINLHATEFWWTIIFALAVYAAFAVGGVTTFRKKANAVSNLPDLKVLLIPAAVLAVYLICLISGAKLFHAQKYASILQVKEAEFTEDLPETAGTDSIALMDTASAQMLGDREIGSLSGVVSQYDVSASYTQIDYQGSPLKVAALDYAGFFKWLNNKSSGVPGYVTVNPVSMSASYQETEQGMIYVPSAYFLQDAYRHIYLSYPCKMIGNLHFEIDEDGRPYYVVSVYKTTVSLFGGMTVKGAIVMDPADGSMQYYELADVPNWVDVVYDGDTICTQYNWLGMYQNGYMNSLFGKKGCRQITTYYSGEEDSGSVDYGYVSKDGDIWIYTGVTSVNSDSSNIGFLLANERTGESHYFNISGADESSAMAAAEGEVQEKGYEASFPSLINVDGYPTYIMVLKDNSGLVKLYAAVNVQQYNLVTTASTQKECLSKYRTLLGIAEAGGDTEDADLTADETEEEVVLTQDGEADITIREIRDVVINGNTYFYLVSEDNGIYKALASTHEEMLLLEPGDQVHLTLAGNEIITCEKK